MLTEDNLMSVWVLGEYYNTILKSHGQLLENDRLWNRPDTCGALKHPAWDPLLDTSPERWMEFYKSLRHNCIYFRIVLTLFEAFIMKYSEWGHGLCLCGLGVKCYCHMGHALFAILQQLLPSGDSFVKSQLESVGNDSNNGFKLLWLLQKRFITMFDLTKEPSWPEWHDDIF
jgi:hypothetical protein